MPPEPDSPPAAPPRRRPRLLLTVLGLLAALAVFGWGIFHLFELRFAAGDVYAPYSTLRNDPLGAAVFYAALAAQPGLRVERNLRPLKDLGKERPGLVLGLAPAAAAKSPTAPPPLTCFYLGVDPSAWPFLFTRDETDRLATVLNDGGRIVITFLPVQSPLTNRRLALARGEAAPPIHARAAPRPNSPAPAPSPSPSPLSPRHRPERLARFVDLIKRWDLDFRRDDAPAPPTARPVPPLAHPEPGNGVSRPEGEPATVSWHSVLDFQPIAASDAHHTDGWRVLYRRDHRPVIVARPFGEHGGELILASDSYFLSNEALRVEARPALLARLVGPAGRVIFDETHLGVTEQPGLMTLARRYRLQSALAALGLLAALFVWRNVSSLVPPAPAPDASAAVVTGRDAARGFLNLLHRSVAPRDLIATCFAQWQQSVPGRRPISPALADRLRALAGEAGTARRHSPAAVYRAMCEALSSRRPG